MKNEQKKRTKDCHIHDKRWNLSDTHEKCSFFSLQTTTKHQKGQEAVEQPSKITRKSNPIFKMMSSAPNHFPSGFATGIKTAGTIIPLIKLHRNKSHITWPASSAFFWPNKDAIFLWCWTIHKITKCSSNVVKIRKKRYGRHSCFTNCSRYPYRGYNAVEWWDKLWNHWTHWENNKCK